MTIRRVELGLKETNPGCSCCAAPDGAQHDTAVPSTALVEYTQILVEGMSCGHCVNSLTEELSALEGVEQVSADLNVGGTPTVTIHHSTPLHLDAVRAAGHEAGYTVADAPA